MKAKWILSFVVVAMALVLVFSAASPVLHAAQAASKKAARAEQHPDLQHAINALQKAQAYLTLADHDFGGHRADALKAVDEAIKQLKLAEQFDKR